MTQSDLLKLLDTQFPHVQSEANISLSYGVDLNEEIHMKALAHADIH